MVLNANVDSERKHKVSHVVNILVILCKAAKKFHI